MLNNHFLGRLAGIALPDSVSKISCIWLFLHSCKILLSYRLDDQSFTALLFFVRPISALKSSCNGFVYVQSVIGPVIPFRAKFPLFERLWRLGDERTIFSKSSVTRPILRKFEARLYCKKSLFSFDFFLIVVTTLSTGFCIRYSCLIAYLKILFIRPLAFARILIFSTTHWLVLASGGVMRGYLPIPKTG